MKRSVRFLPLVAVLGLLAAGAARPAWSGGQQPSQGQKLAHAAEHLDMRLVGTHDLQARSAYQPLVHRYPDGRYILFVGHHAGGPSPNPLSGVLETNGTSILDVTDPRHPVALAHIPGPSGSGESGGSQMVRVCDADVLPNAPAADKARHAVFLLRPFGNTNQQIYDVTDPRHPVFILNLFAVDRSSTHKSWWECDTGIAYVVAGAVAEGWKPGHVTSVFDLSNPRAPIFIRHFALDGQQPGSPLPNPPQVHGPISAYPFRDRVYFPFGVSSNGVLAIVDRTRLITGDLSKPCSTSHCAGPGERFNLTYPVIARLDMNPNWGGHTAMPFFRIPVADWAPNQVGSPDPARSTRDIVVLVSEATANGCREFRHFAFFVDVTTESRPQVVSSFQVPEAAGDFCRRGGRFGAHASNENFPTAIPGIPGVTSYHPPNPFYNKIVFLSYFNAGVRAVDIRDPFNPREVAFFIPATTANTDFRCVSPAGPPDCPRPIQTNNVDTDDRGYIYIVDRANTGLHVLELSGDARKIIE
jgi:hypothetical protein